MWLEGRSILVTLFTSTASGVTSTGTLPIPFHCILQLVFVLLALLLLGLNARGENGKWVSRIPLFKVTQGHRTDRVTVSDSQ